MPPRFFFVLRRVYLGEQYLSAPGLFILASTPGTCCLFCVSVLKAALIFRGAEENSSSYSAPSCNVHVRLGNAPQYFYSESSTNFLVPPLVALFFYLHLLQHCLGRWMAEGASALCQPPETDRHLATSWPRKCVGDALAVGGAIEAVNHGKSEEQTLFPVSASVIPRAAAISLSPTRQNNLCQDGRRRRRRRSVRRSAQGRNKVCAHSFFLSFFLRPGIDTLLSLSLSLPPHSCPPSLTAD